MRIAKLEDGTARQREVTQERELWALELRHQKGQTKHATDMAEELKTRDDIVLESQKKRMRMQQQTVIQDTREADDYAYSLERSRSKQGEQDQFSNLLKQQHAALQFSTLANRYAFSLQHERDVISNNRTDSLLLMTQGMAGTS